MVIVFVEDTFFGNKTIRKLDYYKKQYLKLYMILFSTPDFSLNTTASYILWNRSGYISLRDSTDKNIDLNTGK